MQPALDTADELRLGLGRQLIVHPAQRPALRAQRIVHLHEARRKIVLGKFLLTKRAGEEAAVVALLFEVDDVGAFEGGFSEDHLFAITRRI